MESRHCGLGMFALLTLFDLGFPFGGLVELQFEIRVYIRVLGRYEVTFGMRITRASASVTLKGVL